MYKLQSGDISNEKYIEALEADVEFYKTFCDTWEESKLKYEIYREELSQRSYDIYATALTCSDSIKIPIVESEARLLWFVLSVNYKNLLNEVSIKIESPVHAKYLFDLCGGDYSGLDLQNDHSERKHKEAYCRFMARHTALYPEKNIYWEIPVSFYAKQCMVAGSWATFAYASIGETKYKIPRNIFLKFFRDSISEGKIVANSSNDIRLYFDETDNEALFETLVYMGYNIFKKIKKNPDIEYYYDDDIDPGLIAHLLNRNAVLCDNEEDRVYWNEVSPNSYHFLRRGEEYLPVKYGSEYIYIYRI